MMIGVKRCYWYWLTILTVTVYGPTSETTGGFSYRETTASVTPLSFDGPVPRIKDVAADDQFLYLLDAENHRILVTRDGVLKRTIGGIGNAPGEFYYPSAIAVSETGDLFVNDSGNNRVQSLDTRGRVHSEFASSNSWGMAASSDRVYLGRPIDDHLIYVYAGTGRLLGHVGQLLSPAALVGDLAAREEEIYSRALNRVHIAVDRDSNVWVAFQHAPLLRKYSSEGVLLLEERVDVPGIEDLEQSIREPDKRPPLAPSINIDGVQLTVIFRDIAYDRTSNTMIVLLGDSRVLAFSVDGDIRYLTEFVNIPSALTAIAPTPDGRHLALSSYDSPVLIAAHPLSPE